MRHKRLYTNDAISLLLEGFCNKDQEHLKLQKDVVLNLVFLHVYPPKISYGIENHVDCRDAKYGYLHGGCCIHQMLGTPYRRGPTNI